MSKLPYSQMACYGLVLQLCYLLIPIWSASLPRVFEHYDKEMKPVLVLLEVRLCCRTNPPYS